MKTSLWRHIVAVALVIAMLIAPTTLVSADTDDNQILLENVMTSQEGMQLVCETDQACLYFNAVTTVFCIENKHTGYQWSSAPLAMETDGTSEFIRYQAYSLLYLDYYDYTTDTVETVFSYENSVQNGDYTCEFQSNGVKIVFVFAEAGITIPLFLKLDGDHITVSLDAQNMTYDASLIVPLQVYLTPFMCSGGGENDDGYVFVPDGSGALVSFSSSKLNAPAFMKPVYGKDSVVDALDSSDILLPCYGVSKGENSLLAVISQDAEDAYVHCEGRSDLLAYTHVWASFKLLANMTYQIKEGSAFSTKVYEDGGIKADEISISYYALSSEKSGYAAMAERYRKLLFSEEQLSSAAVHPALYMDLYATVQKVKSILGFQIKFDSVLTSTDDVKQIVETLSTAGVDSMVVKYNTWNKQENSGKAVTKISWKKSVGDVSALITEMQSKGCSVYPAINRIMTYEKSSNPFHSMTQAVRDLSSTLVMGEKKRHVTASYFLNHKSLSKNIKKIFSGMQKKKLTQVAVDDIANVLYSDFTDDVVKRSAFVELLQSSLGEFTQNNKMMCTSPNAYAAVFADEIMALPTQSSGHVIFDQDVPFLQLVYSGMIRYGSEAINLSGNPKKAFLKALETGSMPCYAWVGKNSDELIQTKLDYLFSADYTVWQDVAIQQYKTVKGIIAACEGTPMVDHEMLAEGVSASYYANGTCVIINHNDDVAVLTDGSTVGAHAFEIRKGA